MLDTQNLRSAMHGLRFSNEVDGDRRARWAKTCERSLAHNAKGFSGTSSKVPWLRLG
jgi:hypothetical protein